MNMLNSVTKQPKGKGSAIAMKSNDNSADMSPIWKWSHVENDFYTSKIIKTEMEAQIVSVLSGVYGGMILFTSPLSLVGIIFPNSLF